MRAVICGANGAMGKLSDGILGDAVVGRVSIDGENGVPETFAEMGNVNADMDIDFSHHTAVADVSTVPVILYNVPGRTGCNLQPKTVARLAEHPNIVAIKEAAGNMAQAVELFALCGDKIDIYSGEDALTVPMMAMGGSGAISVLSNVVPKGAVEMSDAALRGDFETAAKLQCKFLPLINALFSEVNPIPAKAAVSAMGFGADILRLPLTPMEDGTRAKLYEEMRKLGIEV